jgi:hypothetical protein
MTKKQKKVLGPSSEAHRKFLQCTSSFVIFGGGAKTIWPVLE